MAWSKTQTAIAAGLAVLLLGTTTSVVLRKTKLPMNTSSQGANIPSADRATPKGSLLIMAKGMKDGDPVAFVNSFVFSGAEEVAFRSVLEQLVVAVGRFRQAATNRFGVEETLNSFPNLPVGLPVHVIGSARETVNGETATVDVGKGGRPLELSKGSGEWKTTVDGFYHLPAGVLKDYCVRLIAALDETAAEIPSAKYATAMDAVNAVKQKAR